MNSICFSLYGAGLKYLYGFERNLRTVRAAHPNYAVVGFMRNDIPEEWLDRFDAAAIEGPAYFNRIDPEILAAGPVRIENIPPMFWRILAIDLAPRGARILVRDSDSRFTPRECAAVRAWEQSGKVFHTMRDHPAHMREINGGMWGVHRVPGWPKMAPMVWEYLQTKHWKAGDPDYGLDQEFLCRYVWPTAKRSVLQHDEFSHGQFGDVERFPTPEVNGEFVGEVWEVSPDGAGGFTEQRRVGDINSRGR